MPPVSIVRSSGEQVSAIYYGDAHGNEQLRDEDAPHLNRVVVIMVKDSGRGSNVRDPSGHSRPRNIATAIRRDYTAQCAIRDDHK